MDSGVGLRGILRHALHPVQRVAQFGWINCNGSRKDAKGAKKTTATNSPISTTRLHTVQHVAKFTRQFNDRHGEKGNRECTRRNANGFRGFPTGGISTTQMPQNKRRSLKYEVRSMKERRTTNGKGNGDAWCTHPTRRIQRHTLHAVHRVAQFDPRIQRQARRKWKPRMHAKEREWIQGLAYAEFSDTPCTRCNLSPNSGGISATRPRGIRASCFPGACAPAPCQQRLADRKQGPERLVRICIPRSRGGKVCQRENLKGMKNEQFSSKTKQISKPSPAA
jgi:hypothetical protein